jgi:hypothetical protein
MIENNQRTNKKEGKGNLSMYAKTTIACLLRFFLALALSPSLFPSPFYTLSYRHPSSSSFPLPLARFLFFWRFLYIFVHIFLYIDRKKHLLLVKWIIIIWVMMVVEWWANTHTHTYTRKKRERDGVDVDEVDLFEKINIVPWLPLPSLNGAQKSLLFLFFSFSLRYVLCTW